MKKRLLAGLLLILAAGLFADEARTALVIGNAGYASAPLRNPVNDAQAIAEKLEYLGFEVESLYNAGLREMDEAVRVFNDDLIERGGVGLFYYAGHAMQVNGENYLIPVGAHIQDEDDIRYQAYNAGIVLDKLDNAGTSTNLVILDACRDNPFARSSRSASSRGLAVVNNSPGDTLIAYATSPGETAADGSGDHGIFTQALLNNIDRIGLDVEIMLRDVTAEVTDASNGTQTPWKTSNFTQPFYFATEEIINRQLSAERSAVEAELSAVEAEIARINREMEVARSEEERRTLEIERQRQQALQEAARIREENLRAEEARQREELARLDAEQAARERQQSDEAARQEQLSAQAEARRRELAALQNTGDDPDSLIENIQSLEAAITEIDASFEELWQTARAGIEETYLIRFEGLDGLEMDPWENEEEFAERVADLRAEIEGEKAAELTRRGAEFEESKGVEIQALRAQLIVAVNELESREWILTGDQVMLNVSDFDRNAKTWSILIRSQEEALPFQTVLVKDISRDADMGMAYRDFTSLLDSNSLMPEIYWGLNYADDTFSVVVDSVGLCSLIDDGTVVLGEEPDLVVATFPLDGNRLEPERRLVTVNLTTHGEPRTVYYQGDLVGTTPVDFSVLSGAIELESQDSVFRNMERKTFNLIRYSRTLYVDDCYVRLESDEGGLQVYSGSTLIGQTPFITSLLAAGENALRLRNSQTGAYRERTLNLHSGNNGTVQVSIIPDGFVLVEAGSFQMGSTSGDSDEEPVHTVNLTRDFYMEETEVTWTCWKDVYDWAVRNGYTFANTGRAGDDGLGEDTANEPVTVISWRDAIVWCNAASEKDGLTPVYTFTNRTLKDATNASACDNADCNFTAQGYRLPTEAEWEYAARGG